MLICICLGIVFRAAVAPDVFGSSNPQWTDVGWDREAGMIVFDLAISDVRCHEERLLLVSSWVDDGVMLWSGGTNFAWNTNVP